ncbi:MAG: pentapeptide repeat-containing protein, partial [Pseudomonadota bacterium]
ANLSDAYLVSMRAFGADFSGAQFVGADVQGVRFEQAKLMNTDFSDADVDQSIFTGADLSGASLASAKNLKQTQIADACGNKATTLPPGITISPCE